MITNPVSKLGILIILIFISGCTLSDSKKHRTSSEILADTIQNNQSQQETVSSDTPTINIGLMLSEKTDKSKLSMEVVHAAELAIQEVNTKLKAEEIPFKLIVRSCDGPWGVGSRETVSLVYDDNVKAIIGSLDGRNAHLVEQVATKAHIVMLSTRATDPTLSQAFVPWYFRCIPNDDQQAIALFNQINADEPVDNMMVISDDSYDGKLGANSFLKLVEKNNLSKPRQIIYDYLKPDFKKLIIDLEQYNTETIVLFGNPETTFRVLQEIQNRELSLNVYGSISILGENKTLLNGIDSFGNFKVISPGFWFSTAGKSFQKGFYNRYGYKPGPPAAYTYDGVNLILETIQEIGDDWEDMRDYLSGIVYEGITGKIQFDKYGNRLDNPNMAEIKNGIPVLIQTDE